MDIYDAISMTIHSNENIIEGRTTIQKLLYFQTVKIPKFSIPYHHYFYGPFSRDVASALEDLSAFSYVNEIVHSGLYDSYSYELTKKGNNYAETKTKEFPKEHEKILEIIKICREFCDLKSAPLSYAAKSHYILISTEEGIKGKYTTKDVLNIGKNFDWNITEDDIETGISLLQKLNLVGVS
ncbi:MAG: hypothetical protein IIA83_01195 [Thaumarchaeota archaeon]|nr:hypothetical protein [Nitrososphaerota archaeon]